MTEMDPYKVLRVPYDADLQQIRTQFKRLVLKAHPDRGGNPKVFQIIKNAYSYLYKYKINEKKQLDNEQRTIKAIKETRETQSEILKKEFNKIQHKAMNINPNDKNFDSRTFNKLFNQYKTTDADDRGYEIDTSTERVDAEELLQTITQDNIENTTT